MKFSQNAVLFSTVFLLLVRPNASAAPDSEIDRLLKKLPPPEKLVKRNEHVVHVTDPAMRDPLVKQIDAASNAKQPKRALELSRQLAARYPQAPPRIITRDILPPKQSSIRNLRPPFAARSPFSRSSSSVISAWPSSNGGRGITAKRSAICGRSQSSNHGPPQAGRS